MADDEDMAAATAADAARVVAAMEPWSSGRTYLNLSERPVDPAGAYPHAVHERLRRIRASVDPHAVMRANHEIAAIGQPPPGHPARSESGPRGCPRIPQLVRKDGMGMSVARSDASLAALPDQRHLRQRLLTAATLVILAGAAVSAVPGLEQVRERFASATPGWLVAVLAFEVASCLAFVAVFRGIFCGRLGWKASYQLGMAAQGTNVLLPAGGASGLALGAWVLSRMGVPARDLGRRGVAFFVVTSAVNFSTAVVVGAALAFGFLGGALPLALTAGPAILAAVAIMTVMLVPRALPRPRPSERRVDRALAELHGALSDGVREAGRLLAAGNPLIVAGAIGYMALDAAALGAAFAAVGSLPPLGVLLLAYVLGQLGGLLPVPGGVGGADGGLIAALALYGVPLAEAAAAVLAYRVFQLGLPAVLGCIAAAQLPRVLAGRLDADPAIGREPVVLPAPVAVAAGPAVPVA